MTSEPHAGYLELRALAEDVATATSAGARKLIIVALRHWLATHCAHCGILLTWPERQASDQEALITLCTVCELKDIPPPPDASDDVPF